MSVFERMTVRRKKLVGFTLLEVMIAVVILAIGLSALFTSEAGAVRIAQRARTTTVATLLARCKMAEIEEKIAKEGMPSELTEGHDECCEDGEHDGFKCEWKVERIKLPESEDTDKPADEVLSQGATGKTAGSKSSGKGGILDAMSSLTKLDPNERFSGATDFLSGNGTNISSSVKGADRLDRDETEEEKKRRKNRPNPEGRDRDDESHGIEGTDQDPMASMAIGLAMPMLRPVIEEGTRRASVVVHWNEGAKEHTFELVQFMVSEQQIILPDSNEDDGGVSAGGTTGTTSTTGTSGTSSTTATPGKGPSP